jgi:hypothetical protein
VKRLRWPWKWITHKALQRPWMRTYLSHFTHLPNPEVWPYVDHCQERTQCEACIQSKHFWRDSKLLKASIKTVNVHSGSLSHWKGRPGDFRAQFKMLREGKWEAPALWLTITRSGFVSWWRLTCCFYMDNLDSIGKLLEEKLDFHEVLNECKCF